MAWFSVPRDLSFPLEVGGAIAVAVVAERGPLAWLDLPVGLGALPMIGLVLLERRRRRSVALIHQRLDAISALVTPRAPSELDVARERRRRRRARLTRSR
jgi:hypothetical protein